MREPRTLPRTRRLTSALLFALSTPLAAQTAPVPQSASTVPGAGQTDPATLDVVHVTGIRGSLTSSMNVKRDAQGIVDGIVAEDIGKFPETNLAESLQRISGVSIDRSLGEGSRVTVRGVGPDFNLVLLNGRQMPGASIEESNASNSRAFDFANLASESISGIEVFKTSRASTPTGGIGATINIKTSRPLDNPGLHANLGLKGVHDSSNENLPGRLQGNALTPEISGIFSNTSADGRFGVSLSGSYQERDFGYSQVGVPNGWRAFRGDATAYGTIPQPGAPGSESIVNRPGTNAIYSVPQNLNYRVVGVERQRTNGQLTLQYKPLDNITTTLDYTYSENKIQQQRNEMSVWFNYGPSASAWTNGPVAGPVIYSEIVNPPTSDLATAGSNAATRNQNKSLGFNVDWAVTDQFKLNVDLHRSTAEAESDSPYGSSNSLGVSGFYRGTSVVDFSKDFPMLQQQLGFGLTGLDPSRTLVTGSAFRNSYMKSEIDQAQVNGDFTFENYSQLKFGIGSTEVKNRSAFSNVQRDTWAGAGTAADYPDDLWIPSAFAQYLDAIDGSDNSAQFNQLFLFDFERARQATAQVAGDPSLYRASSIYSTDRRVTEKSKNAYLQWNNSWDDLRVPINLAAGVRYEETRVDAQALVPVAVGIDWVANNELPMRLAASVGLFRKNIDNYIGVTTRNDASLGLNTLVGGAYWNQALGNGCASADLTCIRNYIFRNRGGAPGVVRGPDDSNGNATGVISGQPGDNADMSGFNFRPERVPLGVGVVLETLLRDLDAAQPPAIYVGSTTLATYLPGLRAHNPITLPQTEALASIWIGNRTRIAAHQDLPDNLACVVAGRRRFTLFPPEQLANLYIGPLDLTPAGQPVSLVDTTAPDLQRFPRYTQALEHALVAELEPGDALFIPSMWWHHIEALQPFNVLVNFWWRQSPAYMDSPMNALMLALLTIRDLPTEQRATWHDVFRHYVFEADAHTAAHVPDAVRGVLATMDDAGARSLRARLLQRLNR
nr:TonB-dependent receptor [Xanthomonas fragariae]